MKPLFFALALCFIAINGFAEVILRGSITYQNTGKKMKALQITARGASPTITRSNTNTEGVFILTFPNGKVGDLVTLELGTLVYDLVNDPRELNVTLTDNPNYKIRLVVCKKGERDANAVTYYNISTKYLETNYQKHVKKKDAEIAQLQKQLTQNGANADALNKQIYYLYAEKAKLDEQLEAQKKNAFKMAEDFSHIDLAQADAIYRKAFDTFKQGDIEGTRQVLNSKEAKLQEENRKKLKEEVTERKKRLIEVKSHVQKEEGALVNAVVALDSATKQSIKKKFFEGQMAILQNKYDEAERLYTEGVLLDSTNVEILSILAYFLSNQNETQKAIAYYERVLLLSKTDDLIGMFCNNLGMAYAIINKMPEAEKYLLQALDIYKRLAKSNQQPFELALAGIASNLGEFYRLNYNIPEAEKYSLQALDIYARWAKSNPQQFEPALASIANNLGEFYRINSKMPEAEKYYLQALDIYARLAKSNLQKFESALAITAMNLGIYYWTNNKMTEAGKYYLQALDTYARLAKSNPQQFVPVFARTSMNLGIYYATKKMPEAEKYFLQALNIYSQLTHSNPQQFESDLATTAMNLGAYYSNVNKMPESEKYLLQSLDLRTRLTKSNPQRFEPDLGLTQINLGKFYQNQKDYPKAEMYLTSALAIYEKLEKVTPSVFGNSRKEMWRNIKAFYEKWIAIASTTTEKTALEKKLKEVLARE